MKRALSAVLMVCAVGAPSAYGQNQEDSQRNSAVPGRSLIYKLEELTGLEIAAFSRQRTLFILPVGILEEHGLICPSAPIRLARSTATGASRDGYHRRSARPIR